MAYKPNIDDANIQAASEMIQFINGQVGMSYNDLTAYAYDNDKADWIEALRKKHIREMIAFALRDKRRSDAVPYKNTLPDSFAERVSARDEFRKRSGSDL